MALPPLIRPKVVAQPTLDTANWFLQLRWVAVVGQLLTMAVVSWGFRIELPLIGLLSLIGVTATTNVFYWIWLSHLHRSGLSSADRLPSDQVISALMLIDIVVLSGMLFIAGGMANPFSLFYFVNIAVAAAIVSNTWAWAVWITTVACMTLLLVKAIPLEALANSSLQPGEVGEISATWTIPKLGLFASFATCSGVITYFITVLTGELRQREQAMQEAEDARVRNRQLEGLATLAAGAAHELATPLTTIAVVAKELSRALDKQDAPSATKEDVKLIRSELDQCRLILDRMTSAAGDAAGERLTEICLEDFIDETMIGVRQAQRINLTVEDHATAMSLLPVQATAQAVRNLIQNAIDASDSRSQVALNASTNQAEWILEIRDTGQGMTPDVLERIGQPFFTTKEPGRGMGLGLYLTENVIRRLGGQLDYESEPEIGTTARLRIPTTRA